MIAADCGTILARYHVVDRVLIEDNRIRLRPVHFPNHGEFRGRGAGV